MEQPEPPLPERLLAEALSRLADASLVTDAEQRIVFANEAFTRMTGYQESELRGRNCRLLQGSDTDPATVAAVRDALAAARTFRGEILNYRRDGRAFWNLLTITPLKGQDGEVEHFVSVQQDVTAEVERRERQETLLRETLDQRETTMELLAVAARLGAAMSADAVAETVADSVRTLSDADWGAVAVWDAETTRLRIAAVTGTDGDRRDRMLRFQLSPSESGELAEMLVHPKPILVNHASSHWAERALAAFTTAGLVATPVSADGSLAGILLAFWVDTPPAELSSRLAERFAGLAGLTSVALTNAGLVDRIRRSADLDAVTGLASRAALERQLAARLADRGSGGLVSVLFGDIDRFKRVNDGLGHGAGDDVLRHVAHVVRGAVRAEDTVARVGGDEFVVVLSSVQDRAEPDRIARRVQSRLRAPIDVAGRRVYITMSVGSASSDEIDASLAGSEAATELLRRADAAMYRMKDSTRGRPPRDVALDELRLDADLHGAAERGEFVPVFQPQLDARTRRIVAHETLVRWHHPRFGELDPAAFLSVAEDNGTIAEIGRVVLDGACRFAARAAEHGAGEISVNLSSRQLAMRGFGDEVQQVLDRHGREPGHLTVEVTESNLITDLPLLRAELERLRAVGVGVAIDDFGTGYSSLSQLQDLPVTEVKIDRSFVHREGAIGRRLVAAIVQLARDLGLRVVAEGVETEEQFRALQEAGCDRVQGYLLGRPLQEAAALRFLAGADHRSAPLGAITERRPSRGAKEHS